MRRIALKAHIENHQWRYFMVEKGTHTEITHDEMADLFEAKRLYVTAVYTGVLCG